MKDIIIKGGEVVTPFTRSKADILISKGIIQAIGRNLDEKGKKVINAAGKLVLPGTIDAHTHMALPMKGTTSSDSFWTGTRAAACGGVTTIIDFTEMADGKVLLKAFRERKKMAQGQCAIDWALHSCLRGWVKGSDAAIDRLIKEGVTSFKMFTVYGERGLMSGDGEIFEALQATARRGAMVTVHSENAGLVDAYTKRKLAIKDTSPLALAESRPNVCEGEAVQRMISLAEAAGGRLYIVHMSTKEALRALKEGQRRGVNVVGETCPQYLLLDRDSLEGRKGHRFTCVPPLRDPIDKLVLWQGVEEGDIAVIGTDHCPFFGKQKDKHAKNFTKIPLGLPGVETLMPLTYTYGVRRGHISVNQMVQVLSANPAMVFGMYPQKGILQPGSDADIVIFDPEKKVTLRAKKLNMNTDYSPYEGLKLVGYPEMTFLRGKLIVNKGKYVGDKGDGKYIKREVAG